MGGTCRVKEKRFTDRSAEAEETTSGRTVGIGFGHWGRRGKGGVWDEAEQ